MTFEKFDRKSSRKTGPSLSVRTDGRMRLNAEATRKLLDLGITRLDLLWDRKGARIGLKRAPDDDQTSYKLTFSKEKNSADLAVKAFFRHIELQPKTKIDLALEWNEVEEMFQAKLPKDYRKTYTDT
jgi:hypothetical protein